MTQPIELPAAIRAQAFRDAAEMVEQIKPESSSPNGQRALEAYQLSIATALRISAKLTEATPTEPTERTMPPGGWPAGGTQVAGWHLCTACDDSIYPGEHVYDNGDNTVRCAVCEIKSRTPGVKP